MTIISLFVYLYFVVSGKSRIAVEVTTQFDDVIAPDRVDVNGYLDSMLVCPTNKARNELRQTYTTNIIPSLPQVCTAD